MPATGAQAAQTGGYDRAERERLRRRLLGYMDSQQIGVPTLQQRLAAATSRNPHEIPLSTLQRFLAGKHRTNDVFVRFCQQFLLTISAPEGYAEFGEALSGFYRAAQGNGASSPASVAKLAGQFRVFRRGGNGDPEAKSFALIEFAPVASASFVQVTESVIDSPDSLQAQVSKARRREFDGVALARGNGLLILLRDVLTRADKAYRLEEINPPAGTDARTLAGHGFDQQFRAGPRPAALIGLDVIAMRAEEE